MTSEEQFVSSWSKSAGKTFVYIKDLKQLTCSAVAMQPGTRMTTSAQTGKVHQCNTMTARQEMTVAQQENISNDITLGTVCE